MKNEKEFDMKKVFKYNYPAKDSEKPSVFYYSPFVKYPSIQDLNNFKGILEREGYLFEKIDGSLSQVRRIGFEVKGGTKANYLTGQKAKIKDSWFSNFLRWMYSNKSLLNLPECVVMYGEWLDPVNVEYPKKSQDRFYFIDLGFIEKGKVTFFDYNEAVNYLRVWGISGIEILKPIAKGEFDEDKIRKIMRRAKSKLGSKEIEGVVLKNYDAQEFIKILHPKYAEVREEQKGMERYVTKARVTKAKRRLLDTYGKTNPSLEEIALEVSDDIFKEVNKRFSLKATKGVIRIKKFYYPE